MAGRAAMIAVTPTMLRTVADALKIACGNMLDAAQILETNNVPSMKMHAKTAIETDLPRLQSFGSDALAEAPQAVTAWQLGVKTLKERNQERGAKYRATKKKSR